MSNTAVWILMGFIGGLWGMGGSKMIQQYHRTNLRKTYLGAFFLGGSLVVLAVMMVGAA